MNDLRFVRDQLDLDFWHVYEEHVYSDGTKVFQYVATFHWDHIEISFGEDIHKALYTSNDFFKSEIE